MAMIPFVNPREVQPRLKRGKSKRLKFRPRSPCKGYRVNPRREKRMRRTHRLYRHNIGEELAIMANPRRKRRYSRRRMTAKQRMYFGNPRRQRSHRRYHRNPSAAVSMRRVFSGSTLQDALWGGAGFVGTKMLTNVIPVPAQFKIGAPKLLTGAVSAWALSFVGSQVAGRRVGNMLLIGGLISVATDAIGMVMPMVSARASSTAGLLGDDYAGDGLGAYLPMEGVGIGNGDGW